MGLRIDPRIKNYLDHMWGPIVGVILNIAVVTNVIPNTGITLPFISYGGSAVLLQLAEIGMVLNVARNIPVNE